MLRDEVKRIWPELEWIEDEDLRSKTTDCWEKAFEYSPLTPADLERIPFTLKVPDCPVTFMAHKRAVVHVARDAAAKVEEFFGEVQVPTETVVEVKNGKKREVRRKFFPGYVLVEMEMTDDAWHLVRNTPKVTGFVGAGKKATPLTDEEVNQILHQSVATQEKPRPTEVFDKGERIRIVDGPFASFNGVVEEVNFDRSTVKVMVTIFGRETPVEIEFRQVQKLV